MFRCILTPVDPARSFDASCAYAVALAQRFKAKLIATYIIDEQLVGPVGSEATQYLDEALEWVGRDAMEDFARHHPDLEVGKTLAYGNTATTLFQMVLQTGADCVVLGPFHRRANPKLWGSTAAEVVHHTERPTFVVRSPATLPKEGDTIVVPFDGTERPVANLVRIARFAKELGAKLDLVYVARPQKASQALAILDRGVWLAEQEGVEVTRTCLQSGLFSSRPRLIHAHAKQIGSPLIAISRLGARSQHTGRSRTVGWLVAHAEVPVWVVRR